MEENMVGPATVYEIINKNTGEVVPVREYEAGDNGVDKILTVHLESGDPVVFVKSFGNNNEVELSNDMYDIREVGTNLELDGTGTVEVETTPEGEVEVTHSDDAPETAGEAETVPETEEQQG